jgi:hypothetical protein
MVILGIDWGKIFSIPFWLEVNPGELSDRFEKIFLLVLLVCYASYGAIKLVQRQLIAKRQFIKAKFLQKVGTYLLTMAFSFSFIFFFRYEAIPVLGGRFWILIWVLMGIGWFIYLLLYFLKELPQQLKALEKRNKLKKYFSSK